MGPVVALIGLELAGTAAGNAGLIGDKISSANVTVFLVTLLVAVFGSVMFRKFLSVIPFLIALLSVICRGILWHSRFCSSHSGTYFLTS